MTHPGPASKVPFGRRSSTPGGSPVEAQQPVRVQHSSKKLYSAVLLCGVPVEGNGSVVLSLLPLLPPTLSPSPLLLGALVATSGRGCEHL